ncbi:hypothetical protein QTP70_007567, partial [Hemibagrus guttatus]
MEMRQDVTRR